jgi:hypothetical protein
MEICLQSISFTETLPSSFVPFAVPTFGIATQSSRVQRTPSSWSPVLFSHESSFFSRCASPSFSESSARLALPKTSATSKRSMWNTASPVVHVLTQSNRSLPKMSQNATSARSVDLSLMHQLQKSKIKHIRSHALITCAEMLWMRTRDVTLVDTSRANLTIG